MVSAGGDSRSASSGRGADAPAGGRGTRPWHGPTSHPVGPPCHGAGGGAVPAVSAGRAAPGGRTGARPTARGSHGVRHGCRGARLPGDRRRQGVRHCFAPTRLVGPFGRCADAPDDRRRVSRYAAGRSLRRPTVQPHRSQRARSRRRSVRRSRRVTNVSCPLTLHRDKPGVRRLCVSLSGPWRNHRASLGSARAAAGARLAAVVPAGGSSAAATR